MGKCACHVVVKDNHDFPDTLFFLYKNIVFQGQAEYSYFSADFRL